MNQQPIIQMKSICKNFGHVRALYNADFFAFHGEVTAIVGDNGSGKSTLIKLLCGVLKPDSGHIIIDNRKYSYLTPHKAIEEGITTVYQDLALDNKRDCVGNIFLGRELTKYRFWLDRKAMIREAQQLLDKLNINIQDVTVPVAYLSGGQRQGIAIARALLRKSRIIIFDEPTAAMGIREAVRVMEIIRSLKDQGVTVIMISHNLFQTFNVADRISIMKSGQCIGSVLAKESSPSKINDIILSSEEKEFGDDQEVSSVF
jgi:ABC-type sugar transport system ATPase subunit